MKGYKGIEVRRGILRSKYNSIFELNIPAQERDLMENTIAFSECGYSFCGSIEDVLYHESIMNIESLAMRNVKLFEIETRGIVRGTTFHYKAESIIVKREILQNEIIEYFANNLNAAEILYKEVGKENYEKYRKKVKTPYRVLYDKNEIEQEMVRSCIRLGQEDLCVQNKNDIQQMSICESCIGKEYAGDTMSYSEDYFYLMARSRLIKGHVLKDIKEYHELKERNQVYECEALEHIERFVLSNSIRNI